jgi:hypothetical protein
VQEGEAVVYRLAVHPAGGAASAHAVRAFEDDGGASAGSERAGKRQAGDAAAHDDDVVNHL